MQTAGISESTLTQANKVKGDEVLKMLAAFIDGKHATAPGDIRIVASVGSNVLMAHPGSRGCGRESDSRAIPYGNSGISWQTRGSIDSSTRLTEIIGAYMGLSQGIGGSAVAAVWEQANDDSGTRSAGAGKGEIGITLNTLWDFKIPRTSNFKRLKYVS